MVRKMNESLNKQNFCKHMVDEIFSKFYDANPQEDRLDEAIEIIADYITDNEYEYLEDNFFSEESIYDVLIKQSFDTLYAIEDDLSEVIFMSYVRYADKDAFAEYERQMLGY